MEKVMVSTEALAKLAKCLQAQNVLLQEFATMLEEVVINGKALDMESGV